MPECKLRVFPYVDSDEQPPLPSATVSVQLNDLLPALSDAILNDCTWIHDFCDDEVKVSEDLFQVIRAYMEVRDAV